MRRNVRKLVNEAFFKTAAHNKNNQSISLTTTIMFPFVLLAAENW